MTSARCAILLPLIEPPMTRTLDAVVYEYGQKRASAATYGRSTRGLLRHLMGESIASSIARYNRLIDDIRNDIVRIEPFFQTARRVVDVDQRREKSMQYVAI